MSSPTRKQLGDITDNPPNTPQQLAKRVKVDSENTPQPGPFAVLSSAKSSRSRHAAGSPSPSPFERKPAHGAMSESGVAGPAPAVRDPVDVRVDRAWDWLEQTLGETRRKLASPAGSRAAAEWVQKQDFVQRVRLAPAVELMAFDRLFEISAERYRYLVKSVFRYFLGGADFARVARVCDVQEWFGDLRVTEGQIASEADLERELLELSGVINALLGDAVPALELVPDSTPEPSAAAAAAAAAPPSVPASPAAGTTQPAPPPLKTASAEGEFKAGEAPDVHPDNLRRIRLSESLLRAVSSP